MESNREFAVTQSRGCYHFRKVTKDFAVKFFYAPVRKIAGFW